MPSFNKKTYTFEICGKIYNKIALNSDDEPDLELMEWEGQPDGRGYVMLEITPDADGDPREMLVAWKGDKLITMSLYQFGMWVKDYDAAAVAKIQVTE